MNYTGFTGNLQITIHNEQLRIQGMAFHNRLPIFTNLNNCLC